MKFIFIKHLKTAYYMPGIGLITSNILTYLILIIACQNSWQNLLNMLVFQYFDKYLKDLL